ncbi:MAG TPA: response regulator [Kofleriaceae bacterium]|jgi:CheY-like chemotaxis protein
MSELPGVKVLVVDDDLAALEAMDALFNVLGASVQTANNVDDAMKIVETFRPDVIISDISMPDQDGHQFIRRVRVRSAAWGGLTPAIALSGRAQSHDQARALLAGFQHHLRKPVTAEQLVRVVRSVLPG